MINNYKKIFDSYFIFSIVEKKIIDKEMINKYYVLEFTFF